MPLGSARESQRGQVLVLFAFVLIALLLVSALAVDYGGWLLARRSYQNAADEAAIAGAYLLTSQITDQCSVTVPSKNHCAREAAWASLKQHLGLSLAGTPFVMADSLGNVPYSEAGYNIWVASPPSDAGAAYPGLASSQKTIFVRVERQQQANISRIIGSNPTVGAWATAGRIPQNFAIVVLCGPPDCRSPNGPDLKVNGNGSNLILLRGDIGSNSFAKTAGSDAAIALSETNASSAYMHYPAQCATTSISCQLVGWDEATSSRTTRKSAQALPQVIDPAYFAPTFSSTATPFQCYSTTDGSIPAVSAIPEPVAQGRTLNGAAIGLTSAVLPTPEPAVTLGANVTVAGTVTATSGGAKLGGIKVTLTLGANTYTDTTTGAGAYTIKNVPTSASAYTLTATDASGVYHTFTTTLTIGGATTFNFSMQKNPSYSGTIYDSVTLAPLAGATVTFAGTGGPYTATANASGVYTIYIGNAATTYTATFSAATYASASQSVTTLGLDTPTQPLSVGLNSNNGTIQGTVKDNFGTGIVGATVTAGSLSTTTTAGGAYSIGLTPGTYNMTASMTGYTSASASNVVVGNGATVTRNFVLTAANSTIVGTVQDQTNGLPLPGVTVTASNGTSSASTTTGPSGTYSMSGLTPSNPRYTVTASLSGYDTTTQSNLTINSGSNTVDFIASANHGLWPTHCGSSGQQKGKWDCGTGSGGCPTVTSPAGADVRCSAYNNTNVIHPGTYKSITISSGQCAWIDPLGAPSGTTSGQNPGVVYVTDTISIGSNAFLFGDGVTVVLGTDAHIDVNNGGGFVINYEDQTYTYGGSRFRTETSINGGLGVSRCSGDSDGYTNLKRSAWTTKARYTWDTSVSPPCYRDDGGAGYQGEIGLAFYLRGTPSNSNSHRFDLSGDTGFLFDGVLYGPKDNVGLGGQGDQAAAGQIVAWTLTYSGDTNIIQRYDGLEIDGPPYLIEPYIGE